MERVLGRGGGLAGRRPPLKEGGSSVRGRTGRGHRGDWRKPAPGTIGRVTTICRALERCVGKL